MAGNHNRNSGSGSSSGSSSHSKRNLINEEEMDMERSSDDEFFAHFEHQWRRYLTNFERRRLRYMDFYNRHKETLYDQGLDQDAIDVLYNPEDNRRGFCQCNCHAQKKKGRRPPPPPTPR